MCVAHSEKKELKESVWPRLEEGDDFMITVLYNENGSVVLKEKVIRRESF